MKLLLVDYISYPGHRNFNKIHIESLLELGHEIHLVGRRGQFDDIENNNNISISQIPDCFFNSLPFYAVTFRLQGIAALLWVKKHIQISSYDAIIVLTYDILSVIAFRSKKPVILINHNNVSQLWSKIKLFITRKLPDNYIHVTLNQDMEARLKELFPDKRVYHVPHGICAPSEKLIKPTICSEDDKFLFCPINRNFDRQFVKGLFENSSFVNYLREHNLRLFVKEQLGVCNCDVIINAPKSMIVEQYNYMIQKAVAVILPYGENFKYRCSGIFFECVARHTPIIATQLNAMAIYNNDVNMRMFTTPPELITSIEYYLKNKLNTTDLSAFNPTIYWERILSKLLFS